MPKHSQNDEELFVLDFFEKNPPKYGRTVLDIGAWTGVELSNSRALVERGWSAVLVEAAAGPFTRLIENCRAYRDNVRLVQAFVNGGANAGLVEMQHTQDAVSTNDPVIYSVWSQAVKDYFPITVPTVPLAALLARFPGPYDLLTLDTEGATLDIFRAYLELESHLAEKTTCIIVEHASAGVSHAADMARLGGSAGYTLADANGENLIFTR